jgi:signal transduction histidine kinase
MPGGGRLQIACDNRRTEAGSMPEDLATGDYVIVSVSDTGIGMGEATLAHAFEPFLTTKEAGRGSGLGLSMVQGFAAQSGGAVHITSSTLGDGRLDNEGNILMKFFKLLARIYFLLKYLNLNSSPGACVGE